MRWCSPGASASTAPGFGRAFKPASACWAYGWTRPGTRRRTRCPRPCRPTAACPCSSSPPTRNWRSRARRRTTRINGANPYLKWGLAPFQIGIGPISGQKLSGKNGRRTAVVVDGHHGDLGAGHAQVLVPGARAGQHVHPQLDGAAADLERLRPQTDYVPVVHRLVELDLVHGDGDELARRLPAGLHEGGLVDQRHDHAAEDGTHRIGVLRHHHHADRRLFAGRFQGNAPSFQALLIVSAIREAAKSCAADRHRSASTARLRPAFLARYMASSACRASCSALMPGVLAAMPALKVSGYAGMSSLLRRAQ